MKRILAVRHADGDTEFECPDCGNYMIVCDTTRTIFSHGEVSETGSEYLFCQKCGAEHGFGEVAKDERPLPEVEF